MIGVAELFVMLLILAIPVALILGLVLAVRWVANRGK